MDAKLKHLEFIQAVIGRMATNSFVFKGWAITIAAGLATLAAIDSRRGVALIALFSTALFWGLDGYYLWLERRFRDLYTKVAAMSPAVIDFALIPSKDDAFKGWVRALFRPHIVVFYGVVLLLEAAALIFIKKGP